MKKVVDKTSDNEERSREHLEGGRGVGSTARYAAVTICEQTETQADHVKDGNGDGYLKAETINRSEGQKA